MFVSLIKFIVVAAAILLFMYCADLSFQGRFEMKYILEDIKTAHTYINNLSNGIPGAHKRQEGTH